MDKPLTTNVLGYYNGNDWPINIVISELNQTITLQHGEYLMDSLGRKINDPYFDRFLLPRQLSKEVGEQSVPLIQVPKVTQAPVNTGHVHSVTSVTEFKHDSKGVRRPVISAPPSVPTPAVNSSEIRAMSVEEARAAGLLGKVRVVPADYGMPYNGNGDLPQGLPDMRLLVDYLPKACPAERTSPESPP